MIPENRGATKLQAFTRHKTPPLECNNGSSAHSNSSSTGLDGEEMETFTPFYAYKEARLDLDPTIRGSTVAIRLPGTNTFTSRAGQKRSHVAEIPIAEDENAFRQRHLATASSIYYRKHQKSLRRFLWRVLEDGKVLSIRNVDISRQSAVADANLTLRLVFPSAIKPGCIALSDSKDHDVLSVFVVTESKHLYTLSLRPEFFRKSTSTEENTVDWCKIYSCSTFSFKQPHRLVALDSDELLVSLSDGGLIKFERNSGADGRLKLHDCRNVDTDCNRIAVAGDTVQ